MKSINIHSTMDNYSALVRLDLIINGMKSKYPFTLNEHARFTQHELQIYLHNYCTKENGKQGGSPPIDIAIVQP